MHTNAIACHTSIWWCKREIGNLIALLNFVPNKIFEGEKGTRYRITSARARQVTLKGKLIGQLIDQVYQSSTHCMHYCLGVAQSSYYCTLWSCCLVVEANTHILLRDTIRNSPYDIDKLTFHLTISARVLRIYWWSILGYS